MLNFIVTVSWLWNEINLLCSTKKKKITFLENIVCIHWMCLFRVSVCLHYCLWSLMSILSFEVNDWFHICRNKREQLFGFLIMWAEYHWKWSAIISYQYMATWKLNHTVRNSFDVKFNKDLFLKFYISEKLISIWGQMWPGYVTYHTFN